MSNQLAAIVWDLDGTLVDSAPDIASALNELLAESGLTTLDTDVVRTMIGNGVAKLIERGFAAAGQSVMDDDLRPMLSRFVTIYEGCATDLTRPYPGVTDALQQFHDAGIRQAVCTNKPEAASRKILDELQLAHYFDIVVGGDTLASRKPDPLPLRHCLESLGVKTSECLMIGDSAVDVATAKAINMRIGVVTHGYAREPAESLGADFLIEDLSAWHADLMTELRAQADTP